MTEMKDMDIENEYKVGIVGEWVLSKSISDKFLHEIWAASTQILPSLEVQVVIDSNDNLHISSGTAGYVDFQIDPVGMKLPIKCWIHTHPFGQAYWSGIDWKTIDTWKPVMERAIVLGKSQRGLWEQGWGERQWTWEELGHWNNTRDKRAIINRLNYPLDFDKWFENHDDLVALGRALLDLGYTAENLQDYYEKPWKWTSEFEYLVAHGSLDNYGEDE